jgi:hypothetical protein
MGKPKSKQLNFEIQIIRNDLVKAHAEKNYPILYKEVMDHDACSTGTWYLLSKKGMDQFRAFSREYPV